MTINAPVFAPITDGEDVRDLLASFSTAFDGEDHREAVVFRVTVPEEGYSPRSMTIRGIVTALKYESSNPGMLLFELKDVRGWTKVGGFYNANRRCGQLKMTPRR